MPMFEIDPDLSQHSFFWQTPNFKISVYVLVFKLFLCLKLMWIRNQDVDQIWMFCESLGQDLTTQQNP